MDLGSETELQDLGLSAEGFTAKQLTTAHLLEADLVLTAELRHRAIAVEHHPPALRTAFTMREFRRLLSTVDLSNQEHWEDPVLRGREIVQLARSRRGLEPPPADQELEIPDPFGRDIATHRLATQLIHETVRHIVNELWSPRSCEPQAGPLVPADRTQ